MTIHNFKAAYLSFIEVTGILLSLIDKEIKLLIKASHTKVFENNSLLLKRIKVGKCVEL
jgi:hypothetical protein